MRKIQLLWMLSILILTPLLPKAQSLDSAKYLYESLPDTLFPEGFLHDQSFMSILNKGSDYELKNFDGSLPGKTITPRHSEIIYNDLYLSQRLKNGLLFGTQTPRLKPWNEFASQSTAEDTLGVNVSLYLNWFKVHELDSNSLQNGWLYYNGNQVVTMPPNLWLDENHQILWNTPSPLDSAFRAIKDFTTFFGGTNSTAEYVADNKVKLTFAIQDYLLQSNQSIPGKIYLDLDDGQGFRDVSLNEKITTTYSTSSQTREMVFKELRIRINTSNGPLQTRFKFPIIFNAETPDEVLFTREMHSPPCYQTYSPRHEGKVSIRYADKGMGLQKPLVLVEGFESAKRKYGNITYEGVASGVILNDNNERVHHGMEKLAWFYDSLHLSGYDIIHVDFEESKQCIEDNMQSLIRVLHWINMQKAREPTIIVGASMGGLIARAALLELERNDCCLNISGYGTFDSPHDGAFIPLGIQMGAKRLQELTTIFGFSLISSWKTAINSPAAREILIDHLDPTAIHERNQLIQLFAGEQPETIRRFAISNGSDMNLAAPMADLDHVIATWGKTQLVTYKHRIHANLDTVWYNAKGGDKMSILKYGASIHGIPSTSSYLYKGSGAFSQLFNCLKIRLVSATGARLATWAKYSSIATGITQSRADKATMYIQGRTNRLLSAVHHQIKNKTTVFSKNISQSNLIEKSGSSSNSASAFADLWGATIYSPNHTFIPSFSALNVGSSYVNNSFRGRMDLIPFHSYISPGLIDDLSGLNQEHIYTDEDIIQFALRSIESIHREIGINGKLNSDYNIAKENNLHSDYSSHIKQLEIQPSTKLSIGCQGYIGNSTNLTADSRQNIEVFVGNGCLAGILDVKGCLEIGDAPLSQSILRVNSGSTLLLRKNSSLKIGPNSKLIIENGAEFLIEQGADIEWKNGQIIVRGTVELMNNAHLNPKGFGLLLFEEKGRLISGVNGRVTLNASRLHIKNSINFPSTLKDVNINECDITLFEKGTLKSFTEFSLHNSKVQYDSPKQWEGLKVVSNTASVLHTEFVGGDPGLFIGANATVNIEHCQFRNAIAGLKCLSTPLSFISNTFMACDMGAYFKSQSFTIDRNLFHACDQGLTLLGRANSTAILLIRNVFSSNTKYGSRMKSANVRMECNDWSYNKVGHKQQNGSMTLGSYAGNTFTTNKQGIKFDKLESLSLNLGQNQFSNNAVFDIQGIFSSTAIVPHNGGHHFLSADYNSFSNSYSTDMFLGRSKVYPVTNPNTPPTLYICPSKGPGKISQELMGPNLETSLIIYPNPSMNPSVTAIYPPSEQDGMLEILSSSGNLMFTKPITAGSIKTDIEVDLAAGSYIVRRIVEDRIESAFWVLL
jgi:hypothetical protein